jgi:hypothetical protein
MATGELPTVDDWLTVLDRLYPPAYLHGEVMVSETWTDPFALP